MIQEALDHGAADSACRGYPVRQKPAKRKGHALQTGKSRNEWTARMYFQTSPSLPSI